MTKITQHNFDWGITDRDVVIFVPNFKRKHLLIPTLERFKTKVPRDKWLILVVNDGVHEDLSDLVNKYNVAYFTLERDVIKERNGCMVRNYAIKRLRSKWLMTKDPEIIVEDDIISKIIELDDVVYRPVGMIELNEQETPKILDNPFINLPSLSVLREWTVKPQTHQAFHNCVCLRTQRLKKMNGYDEVYRDSYGYEDWDMLERLMLSDVEIIVDDRIRTYHIWHPIMRRFHTTINKNQAIYDNKLNDMNVVANVGIEWGCG